MSGQRFAVGEIAVFAVARDAGSAGHVDHECVIHTVRRFAAGQIVVHPVHGAACVVGADGDYLAVFEDGWVACPLDWQLRKINPPAEPASLMRHADLECPA